MRPMRLGAALAAAVALLPVASRSQTTTTTTTMATTTTIVPVCEQGPGCTSTSCGLFLDRSDRSFEKNTTCSNFAAPPVYCLAGRVDQGDTSSTKNRLVVIDWESDGMVVESNGSTKGEFTTVTLTLSVRAIIPPSEGNSCVLWASEPATPLCKLKGGTRKGNVESRVTLSCDLGENLSELVPAAGFGPITDPPVSQPSSDRVLDSIASAFKSRTYTKLDTRKGRLKVRQQGLQPQPNASFDNGLTCPLVADTTPACPPFPTSTTIPPAPTTTSTVTTTSTTSTTTPP